MSKRTIPSVGAKDMRDLLGVARSPAIAILQKQTVARTPRPKDAALATSQPTSAASKPPVDLQQATEAAFHALRRFAPGDFYRWISEYLKFRFGPRHPFPTFDGRQPSDGIYPFEGDADEIRVDIASDWGTGTDEAYQIASLIEQGQPHYTIHLGDVYFVGDTAEVGENFLGKRRKGYDFTPCNWPRGSKASFALNGNHEMYARGDGYFNDILPAMGPVRDGTAQGQPTSFFCLRNAQWCILGLDTGYNSVGLPVLEYIWSPDAALPRELVRWLETVAPQIEKQAIIILTHHEVLSIYDDCFTAQADQISAILKRPLLWLWGHEHRLVLYEAFDGGSQGWPTILGRCIGHGGMPVDLPGARKANAVGVASLVDKRPYENEEKLHVGINGFARLTFKGGSLRIDYIDVFGETVYLEEFRSEAGAAVLAAAQNLLLVPP